MSKISNFGYTKVTIKEKTKLVQKVFSDVAFNYDLMNDVMSFGAHRLWKSKFIDIVNPTYSDKIIDVGSGSGDLVLEIQKRNLNVKIDIVDLNKEMLEEGRKRIKKGNVSFFKQNGSTIPNAESLYQKVITLPSIETLSTEMSSSTIASAIFGSLFLASAVDLIIDLI